MTPVDDAVFWEAAVAELVPDEGEAVRAHLAAGRFVSYRKPDTPPGHVIRRFPDGRRELVRIDRDGDAVVAQLPPL